MTSDRRRPNYKHLTEEERRSMLIQRLKQLEMEHFSYTVAQAEEEKLNGFYDQKTDDQQREIMKAIHFVEGRIAAVRHLLEALDPEPEKMSDSTE